MAPEALEVVVGALVVDVLGLAVVVRPVEGVEVVVTGDVPVPDPIDVLIEPDSTYTPER